MNRRRIARVAAFATILGLAAGAAARAGEGPGDGTRATAADPRAVQLAVRCFSTGASRVIGIDRICYYRCSITAITSIAVRATDLCPDFIDR